MSESKPLDILKGAILLERRGKALYDSVVETSRKEGVKELFQTLSREEDRHIRILNEQFTRIAKGEAFEIDDLEKEHAATHEAVLTQKIVENISGAGYEAAVISAALAFEKNAVKFYSQRASEAGAEDEKTLYEWLAEWEKTHMLMLARLDNELKEKVWYDNQFWPLD